MGSLQELRCPSGKAEEKHHNSEQGHLRAEGIPPHPTNRGFQPSRRIRPHHAQGTLPSRLRASPTRPRSLHSARLLPQSPTPPLQPCLLPGDLVQSPHPNFSFEGHVLGRHWGPALSPSGSPYGPKGLGFRGGSQIRGGCGSGWIQVGSGWRAGAAISQTEPTDRQSGDLIRMPPRERGADTLLAGTRVSKTAGQTLAPLP